MTERKEKHKQKFKERGITLIALVITIIVLLILAGVALATLTGDSGILNNAESAKGETNLANAEEQVALAVQGALTKVYAAGQRTIIRGDLEAELNNVVGAGKYELSEGDAPWTVKVGDYKVEVSANGSISKTGETDNSLTVADLVAGDYIDYIDKNGNTIECAVLYDSSSVYGVQIIALEPVEQITLGGETLEEAIESYNNAIATLNTAAAEGYLNTTYATSARCVGSVPNNPSYESETYFTSDSVYFQDVNGLIKNADENSVTDLSQINEVGITFSISGYWVASRCIRDDYTTQSGCAIGIGIVDWGTLGIGGKLCEDLVDFSSSIPYAKVNDFIPVFTLKSDVKIIGEGSEDVPYEFK